MPKPIRTIFFDAGNTLLHLDYNFIADVLREHGHPRTADDVRRAEYAAKAAVDAYIKPQLEAPDRVEGLLWPTDKERPSYFAVAVAQLGIDSGAVEPVLDDLRRHNEADCLWRVIEPDTNDVLGELRRRGLKLAVVSNSDGRIEADIARRGLGEHFEAVIDSHVVGVEKPDRAIFELAMKRTNATADESLFIGDVFAIDVLGARAAGMEAILIDPLGDYPGEVDCRRIRGLGELISILPG